MLSDTDFGPIDDGTWEFSRDKVFNDLQIILRVNAKKRRKKRFQFVFSIFFLCLLVS